MDVEKVLCKKDNGAKEKAGLKAGILSAVLNLICRLPK